MDKIVYCFKILLYFAIVGIIYQIVKQDYTIYIENNNENKVKQRTPKLKIWKALFFAFILSVYGVFTLLEGEGDHSWYIQHFERGQSVYSQSIGLGIIYDILRTFTRNATVMFLCVFFIGFFLTFMAYRSYQEATPKVLLLLFLSEFFLYGLAAIKQFVANGFSFLFFAYLFRGKKWRSLIFLTLAILFHEAAFILIPIFLFLNLPKKPVAKFFSVTLLIVLLAIIIPNWSKVLKEFLPSLNQQLEGYMDGDSLKVSINYFTAFKGAPIYMILVLGIIHYKELKNKTADVWKYLLIVAVASAVVIISTFSYWMFRLSYLLLMPVFVFFQKTVLIIKNKNDAKFASIFVFGILSILTIRYMLLMFFQYGGL